MKNKLSQSDKELFYLALSKGFISPRFEIKSFETEWKDKFIWMCLCQQWLRNTYDIYVESQSDYDPKDETYQFYTSWGYLNPDIIEKKQLGWYDEYNDWKIYEEALEFGLKEALKMIK